jgi:hypothetical protein
MLWFIRLDICSSTTTKKNDYTVNHRLTNATNCMSILAARCHGSTSNDTFGNSFDRDVFSRSPMTGSRTSKRAYCSSADSPAFSLSHASRRHLAASSRAL